MIRTPLRRLGLAALSGVLAVGALTAPATAAAGRGTVQGTFTTDSGEPIAGASVYAYTAGDQEFLADATTDDDGRYKLRNVRATDVKVQFHTMGMTQWAHRQADFDSATTLTVPADGTLAVDERLSPTGTLSGRLTEASGEPAAWVAVQAFTSEDESATYGYTDENGQYALSVLPGAYKVQFLRDATEQWATGKTERDAADVVRVAAGQTVQVDDTLLATGTLGGRLTASDGSPLVYATVSLYRDDTYVTATSTDEDGRYLFAGVLPGAYRVGFALEGGATQYIPGTAIRSGATAFPVTAGEHTTADDALVAVGRMQGRLTDTSGRPVAEHYVDIRPTDENSEVSFETTTGEDGTWSVEGVFPVDYVVSFIKPDYSRRQYAYGKGTAAAADPITVEPGATATVDDTWADGATLIVRATDAVTGAPVSDFCAWVSGIDAGGCTDGTELEITDLAAGTFGVSVSPGEKSFYLYADDRDTTLTAGRVTTLSVPLTQGGKASATITDRVTGAPVRGACVDLAVLGRGGLGDGQGIACSNAGGKLTTPALRPGTYEMFAYGVDGLGHQWVGPTGGTGDQRAAARLTVKAGKIAKAPAVLLDRAGTITGTLTDGAGEPLADANVGYSSWSSGAGPSHGTETDAEGRWSLDVLGPYAWPLQFSAGPARVWSGGGGNRFTAETIPVTSGATTTYDMALDPAAALAGTVTLATGSDDTWWRLEAYNAVTGDPVGVADAPGTAPYTMQLAGAQQVKIHWHVSGDGSLEGWYDGVPDWEAATKIRVPKSGPKSIDFTLGG
jgi:5-hydroxyisourate hydrolase-like protein (transthyretin family)